MLIGTPKIICNRRRTQNFFVRRNLPSKYGYFWLIYQKEVFQKRRWDSFYRISLLRVFWSNLELYKDNNGEEACVTCRGAFTGTNLNSFRTVPERKFLR